MVSQYLTQFLQIDPQTRFNPTPVSSSLLSASSRNLSSSTNSLTIAPPIGGSSSARSRFLNSFKSALSTSMQHLTALAPGGHSSSGAGSKHSTHAPGDQQPSASVPTTPSTTPLTAKPHFSTAPSPLSARAAAPQASMCPFDAPGPLTTPPFLNQCSPSPQHSTHMSISPMTGSSRGEIAFSSDELHGRFTQRGLDDASDEECLSQIPKAKAPGSSTLLDRFKRKVGRADGTASGSSSSSLPKPSIVIGRCTSSSDDDECDDGGAASRKSCSSGDTLTSDLPHASDDTTGQPLRPPPRLPSSQVNTHYAVPLNHFIFKQMSYCSFQDGPGASSTRTGFIKR